MNSDCFLENKLRCQFMSFFLVFWPSNCIFLEQASSQNLSKLCIKYYWIIENSHNINCILHIVLQVWLSFDAFWWRNMWIIVQKCTMLHNIATMLHYKKNSQRSWNFFWFLSISWNSWRFCCDNKHPSVVTALWWLRTYLVICLFLQPSEDKGIAPLPPFPDRVQTTWRVSPPFLANHPCF